MTAKERAAVVRAVCRGVANVPLGLGGRPLSYAEAEPIRANVVEAIAQELAGVLGPYASPENMLILLDVVRMMPDDRPAGEP